MTTAYDLTACHDGRNGHRRCGCTGGSAATVATIPAVATLVRPAVLAHLTRHHDHTPAAWWDQNLNLHAPDHEGYDGLTLGLEGAYDWPIAAVRDPAVLAACREAGVRPEIGAGWRLDLYPIGA